MTWGGGARVLRGRWGGGTWGSAAAVRKWNLLPKHFPFSLTLAVLPKRSGVQGERLRHFSGPGNLEQNQSAPQCGPGLTMVILSFGKGRKP